MNIPKESFVERLSGAIGRFTLSMETRYPILKLIKYGVTGMVLGVVVTVCFGCCTSSHLRIVETGVQIRDVSSVITRHTDACSKAGYTEHVRSKISDINGTSCTVTTFALPPDYYRTIEIENCRMRNELQKLKAKK